MPTDHPTDLELTQTAEETDTAQSATTSVADEVRSLSSSEDEAPDAGSPVTTTPEQTNASNGSPEPSVGVGTADPASPPDASVDGDSEPADASTITENG